MSTTGEFLDFLAALYLYAHVCRFELSEINPEKSVPPPRHLLRIGFFVLLAPCWTGGASALPSGSLSTLMVGQPPNPAISRQL